MIKFALATAVAISALTAAPAFAAANPASQLCERYRGDLVPVADYYGNQYNLCILPDGYIIEEWTLLRMRQNSSPIYVYPRDGRGDDYFGG